MAVANGDGPTDVEKKIIRQVEYYFGDVNLPRDRFLQEKIKENDGWVDMDTMLNFNRLKSISDDKEAICRALQKSSSGLMEVNEDLTKIRRSPEKPLPDNTKERKDDINARSVYVKGFPTDCTLDLIMEFFEKHGKIDTVFMRREKDKSFKGSVFVTFANPEEESKFLELENVKYGDVELVKMKKEEYFKKKSEEAKLKKKGTTAEEEKEKAEQKKQEEEKKLEEQMTKGAVLFVKGLTAETTIEDMKTFFGDFSTVAWVEHVSGEDKAALRFSEGVAQEVLDKAKSAGDGKIVINDAELEAHVIDGEEEKDYWRKMFRDLADRKQKNKNFQNRKRKFGGGRPNKHGNRGKDSGDGGPAAKAAKAE